MAIGFRDAATGSSVGSTATTINVTIPGTVQVGDGMLLWSISGSTTGATDTMTTPSGWTVVDTQAKNNIQATLYKRVVQGGDAGSAVACAGSANSKRVAVLGAWSGTASVIVDTNASALEGSAGLTHTTPAATASALTSWAAELVMDRGSPGSTTFTEPITLTSRAFIAATGGGAPSAELADTNAAIGSTSIGNQIWTGTVSTASAAMWTVALLVDATGVTGGTTGPVTVGGTVDAIAGAVGGTAGTITADGTVSGVAGAVGAVAGAVTAAGTVSAALIASDAAGAVTCTGSIVAALGLVSGTAGATVCSGTASAPAEEAPAAPVVSGGWYSYLSVIQEAREIARSVHVPVACPNDGEPLRTGPRGQLFCTFDGWTP